MVFTGLIWHGFTGVDSINPFNSLYTTVELKTISIDFWLISTTTINYMTVPKFYFHYISYLDINVNLNKLPIIMSILSNLYHILWLINQAYASFSLLNVSIYLNGHKSWQWLSQISFSSDIFYNDIIILKLDLWI